MKKRIFLLVLILNSLGMLGQKPDTIRAGTIPPSPGKDVVSFVLTTHSSSVNEAKIFYEIKVQGNTLPTEWIERILLLPAGSTITYTQMTIEKNGIKKYLPYVQYVTQ